jgi:exodeoxyribonuclease VII small subunit
MKKITIESEIDMLQNLVEKIKDSKITIDEALKMYEEGINLYRSIDKKLKDAKVKIELIDKELFIEGINEDEF